MENNTNTTNNTATGATMVESGTQGLIFDSQGAEVLTKGCLPSRLPVGQEFYRFIPTNRSTMYQIFQIEGTASGAQLK